MNKPFLLDTNILIYFFEGYRVAGSLIETIQCNVSLVTYIELLSNPYTNEKKRGLIIDFLLGTTVIQTNPTICEYAANIRLNYNLKTPDAIIAATAKYSDFPLITADKKLFQIKEIEIIKFLKK
ncbi:MAG TPA: type II toxin-antitoxin system VapC family toxin [Puia sp.]|jgi:predicted nucleic acid-binding protein|nr:type II toxin-antitoxin system VapC family toxin [Puia sp.]